MSRVYVRRDPAAKETWAAMVLALGVGAVSFYFVRNLVARESVEREAPKRLPDAGIDLSPASGAKS